MTLTWHGRPVSEADKTTIWRGFVIAVAVLVHLFVSVKAQADELPAKPVLPALTASSTMLSGDAFRMAAWTPRADADWLNDRVADSEEVFGKRMKLPTAAIYTGIFMVETLPGRTDVRVNMSLSEPFVGGFVRF